MAKDKLFNLVHSLSASEKKFFHQYAARHIQERDPIYLQLFNAIDKQDDYDEQELKKKFKNPSFGKNFHKVKGYLYDLILKSLVIRQSESSAYSKLLEGLCAAEILCEKFLYTEALDQLQRVRTIAEAYEFKEIALESYRWEDFILATSQLIKDMDVTVADNYEKKIQLINQIASLTEYRQFYLRISMLSINTTTPNPSRLQEAMSMFAHPLVRSEEEPDFPAGKLFHLGLKFIVAKFSGRKKEALQFSQKLVTLLEAYPKQFYLYEFLQIYGYFYLINECLISGEYSLAETFITRLKNVKPLSSQNRYFHLHLLFASELSYLKIFQKKEGCLALIAEYEKTLKENEKSSNRRVEFRNYLLVMNYLVKVKEYHMAVTFVNRILNGKEWESEAPSLYFHARLINLVVHFELGHFELLASLIRQTEYFFLTRKTELVFVRELLHFFKKVLKTNTDVKKEFSALGMRLNKISEDANERNAMNGFNDCGWLENNGIIPEGIITEKLSKDDEF